MDTKNRNELSAALDRFFQYSQLHFSNEEKIARAIGYSLALHLNQSYQELVKQLDQLKREIEEMRQECSSAEVEYFTNLLQRWLIDHVIHEALLMKRALQKYPPSFDPR